MRRGSESTGRREGEATEEKDEKNKINKRSGTRKRKEVHRVRRDGRAG